MIRDGDKPPVGSGEGEAARQYDSYTPNTFASQDWVGYTFPTAHTFDRVVFQEGLHFWDGGWFASLAVQVRQNGQWVNVSGLVIVPAYAGNDGVSFETLHPDLHADPGRRDPALRRARGLVGVHLRRGARGVWYDRWRGWRRWSTGRDGGDRPGAKHHCADPGVAGPRRCAQRDPGRGQAPGRERGAEPPGSMTALPGTPSPREDWVGYTFPTSQTFSRVVFQEGHPLLGRRMVRVPGGAGAAERAVGERVGSGHRAGVRRERRRELRNAHPDLHADPGRRDPALRRARGRVGSSSPSASSRCTRRRRSPRLRPTHPPGCRPPSWSGITTS